MKNKATDVTPTTDTDEDTMRSEYDFSGATRGKSAERYAKGTNLVLLEPDVARIFPTSTAINEALRTLTRVMRDPSDGQRRP